MILKQREIFASLRSWVQSVPSELRIIDASGNRRYQTCAHEVYVLYFVIIITFLYSFNDSDPNSVPNIVSLISSSCLTSLYYELDVRDDINYLLGIHMWFFMMAAMPQILYHSTDALSNEERQTCSRSLDILVSCLEQYKIKIPGAAVILNTINRLRTQDTRMQSQSSTVREWKKPNLVGELCSVSAFRDLFPFPSSLTGRLELFEQPGGMLAEASPPPDMTGDLSWIFDEFADVSAFADWPSVLS